MARVESAEYLEQLDAYLARFKGTGYFDGLRESYIDIRRFDMPLDVLAEYRPLSGAAVLDMGAGTGGLLLACRERSEGRLVGVEVNPDLHRLAELRLADTGIQSVLTDGLTVPLPDASFDLITSLHVLEHTRSPLAYLSEMARLLKPGGAALLACPNRLWPIELHANLPFITYLPIRWVHRVSSWRRRSTRLPERVRFQWYVTTLVEHYFTFFSVRRLCRKVGLAILEVNHPTRFSARSVIDLGAWGESHLYLSRFLNAANVHFISGQVAPYVRSHPLSRFAHWLSILLNWEIYVILGKAQSSRAAF